MGRARGAVRVPGVKLRPANPNAAQSKKNVIVSDDEEEVVDPRLMQVGRDIFRGVVVCATGIRNKREVFGMVRTMGGSHTTDFTDLTTHLIADETGSEKYRCAIVRDIPVVTTSCIEEAYDRWIHGDVFSLEDIVDLHRLLPFCGMKICITGIETADVRARIHKFAKKYGGEYLKNLDKTCTHLLCAVDSSGKIEWANKNNAEREVMRARSDGRFVPPSIHLLWEEWFWDCVHRQGLLPYDDYHITRPRPEPMSRSVMNSPEVLINPPPAATSRSLPPPLPLASLLVDAGDSALPVKRKKDAAGKQWDSIIKRHNVTAANRSIHNASMDSSHMHIDGESYPSESASPMKKAWDTGTSAIPAAPGWGRRSPIKKSAAASGSNNASGISKKISAIKLPPDSVQTSKKSTFLGKFKRTAAFDEVERPQQSEVATPIDTPTEPTSRRPKIFTGLDFILLGDAECEVVTGALEQAGGRVVTNGSPDFFIVRLVGGAKYMLERPTVEHSRFRTECWLERCLFEKRICSTEENVTYVPLVISSSPEDTSNLLVAFSGLDSFERTWVSRLLRGLGVKLSLNFSSRCTHLLCPSGEGIKCAKAKEWNIPIVNFDWVIERTKAAALQVSDESKTPTNIANEMEDGNLKVAKSMQDMYLEKDTLSRPALPEGALFSPVFKISSRGPVVGNGRPPFPTSPSPQRRQLVSNAANSTTTPSKSTSEVSKPPLQSSSKPFPTLDTSNVRPNTNPPENSIKSTIPNPTTSAKKLGKSPFNSPATQLIPSSATPSPLATGSIGGSAIKPKEDLAFESSSGPLSLQSASAKALSRNIGAILGSKRAAEDDLDVATSSAISGVEGPRKRPRRPQPSRSTHSEGFTPRKLGSVPPVNLHENDEESQHTMPMESPSEAVSGLAVNYSDPTEVEERRRLLMLINKSEGAAAEPETTGKRAIKLGPRKSARQRGNHV